VHKAEATFSQQIGAFRQTEHRHRNSYRELKAAADRLAEAPAGIDEEAAVAEFKQRRRRGKRASR
jgi:ferric-dicitrate binding protein FerR (iron transport regulator)